jgi:hypothetical protein
VFNLFISLKLSRKVKASGPLIFFIISFFFSSCQSETQTQSTIEEYLWEDQTEKYLPKTAEWTNRVEIADISVKATLLDTHQITIHENQPRQPRPSIPKSIARYTPAKREVYRLIYLTV